MHYKNGTPAKLGDLVKGVGYNVAYEIQGIVAHLNPHQEECNITIIHIKAAGKYTPDAFRVFANPYDVDNPVHIVYGIEYGCTRDFEKILDAPYTI